jgi:hypothetical protein
MPFLSLLAFCLICWLSVTVARGADSSPVPEINSPRVWSGLILATNPDHPGPAPGRLRNYADKLKHIFGYSQFDLVGEYSEKLEGASERWLVPSKEFYMSFNPGAEIGKHFPMRIVLFQNRKKLAEFETHLTPESPLFIRGPQYDKGQLVIMLRVADASEFPTPVVKPIVPAVYSTPFPLEMMPPKMPKDRPSPGTVLAEPKDQIEAIPTGHLGPTPADRIVPLQPFEQGGPDDHIGPDQRDRGDMDSKLGRP